MLIARLTRKHTGWLMLAAAMFLAAALFVQVMNHALDTVIRGLVSLG